MKKSSWTYLFSKPISSVWEYVADTDRMNYLIGLPRVNYTYEPRKMGGTHRIGAYRILGATLKWKEHPFEWVRDQFFRVERDYSKGPFRYIKTEWTLEKVGSGCKIHQTFTYETVHPIFNFVGYLAIDVARRRDFLRVFETIEKYFVLSPQEKNDVRLTRSNAAAATTMTTKLSPSPPFLPHPKSASFDQKWFDELKDRLLRMDISEPLAKRIVEFLLTASDLDLVKIRPFRLAPLLGVDRMTALVALLKACEAGLLILRWAALCPYCRGIKSSTEVLSKMEKEVHCETCNIRFKADFSKSIELVFSPTPALRDVQQQDFCVGAPEKTPHYLVQARVSAGETKVLSLSLPAGRYLLRSPQSRSNLTLDAKVVNPDNSIQPIIHFIFNDNESKNSFLRVYGGENRLQLENSMEDEITVVLEQVEWVQDSCTAALAASLSEFRNAFSSNLLDLDQNIDFSSMAFMFTDLKESTALYQKLGDAKAFVFVQEHFKILSECIRMYEGGIVKTIGDSVMAVFPKPESALRAAIEGQKRIHAKSFLDDVDGGILTRISIHQGPCFLIRINGILDFFGSTVNLAARLLDHCEGNDITISSKLFDDQSVRQVMKKLRVTAEQDIRNFKGFEDEFEVYRIQLWRAPSPPPIGRPKSVP